MIAALHKESETKDAQLKEMQLAMKKLEEETARKMAQLRLENEQKIEEVDATLTEKEAAFKIMQQEFNVIKDFRRKRHDLLKELEDSKAELVDTEKRHKDIITRLEKKFFGEKIRLQNEANQKIGDLATQAHRVYQID